MAEAFIDRLETIDVDVEDADDVFAVTGRTSPWATLPMKSDRFASPVNVSWYA